MYGVGCPLPPTKTHPPGEQLMLTAGPGGMMGSPMPGMYGMPGMQQQQQQAPQQQQQQQQMYNGGFMQGTM